MTAPTHDGDLEIPRAGFRMPEPPEGLEERLFGETSRAVRFHPWRRRVEVVGALAAAYLAGITTVSLLWQADLPAVVETRTTVESSVAREVEETLRIESLPANPAELEEQLARAAKPVRSQLLREAGDRYLSTEADVESALYCYRKVLDAEPLSSESSIDPDESWLLTVLKHARRQEVNRVERADG